MRGRFTWMMATAVLVCGVAGCGTADGTSYHVNVYLPKPAASRAGSFTGYFELPGQLSVDPGKPAAAAAQIEHFLSAG